MSLFSVKNLKKSSVYITPNFPTLETTRYKFKAFQLIAYFIALVLILIVLLSFLFAFTPLNKIIMFMENDKAVEQKEKLIELEDRIVVLVKELDRISSVDKRLSYALALAKTDSLDSTAAIYDSLRKSKGNIIPAGGSILFVVEKFFAKYLSDDFPLWIKPIKGIIGKEFSPEEGHLGLDFLAKEGTPILAPLDGTIIFADYTTANGKVIIILHKKNYLSVYKHCSAILKSVRTDVMQGEVIALSGNTGTNTTGAHLHFEIWKNAKPINPKDLLLN